MNKLSGGDRVQIDGYPVNVDLDTWTNAGYTKTGVGTVLWEALDYPDIYYVDVECIGKAWYHVSSLTCQ